MKRVCVICGAEFDARGSDKTCGPEHSRKAALQSARLWKARNPRSSNLDKAREHERARYAKMPDWMRELDRRWYARNIEVERAKRRDRYRAERKAYLLLKEIVGEMPEIDALPFNRRMNTAYRVLKQQGIDTALPLTTEPEKEIADECVV